MLGKSQSGKSPVPNSEALEVLEKRKEQGELGYEQKLAYDHIKKYSKLSAEEQRKMVKELEQCGVGAATAIMISDAMPIDPTQLKHILVREKKTFEEDEIAKMMEVVQSHRAK